MKRRDVQESAARREVTVHSPDAVDPFVLLLGGRCRDPVKRVAPLHDASVCLRLTGLDHLVFVVGDEELKAVLVDAESTCWSVLT